jgi:hypothetical protein
VDPILTTAAAAAVPVVTLGALLMRERRAGEEARANMKPLAEAQREAKRVREAALSEANRVRAEAKAVLESANVERATAAKATTDARAEMERESRARQEASIREGEVIREAAQNAKRAAEADVRTAQETLQQIVALTADAERKKEAALKDLSVLEEKLETLDVGFYRPHFTYEDTESYKRAIEAVRDKQERLIKADAATAGSRTMTLDGNAKKGIALVKKQEKLILRAFNADCEAALANVTWSNFGTMEARITKSAEALERLGGAMQTRITDAYVEARLEELRLVYEAAEKRKEEKELQRQQRAAQREEERVQRELAKVQAAAEKEENQYEKALAKARAELDEAEAEQRDAMAGKIAELERRLAEAHERKERAIAQAQLTKVGHVYIISNHGAFGEGVVKIGMTRRLEPEERIQELGDASVPFPFDLHALIYSEDAPALEYRLHEAFWDHRLNWSNDRKEFFRVDLESLQSKLRELGLGAELRMVAEAREYRETLAARQAIELGASDPSRGPLPSLEAMGLEPQVGAAAEQSI